MNSSQLNPAVLLFCGCILCLVVSLFIYIRNCFDRTKKMEERLSISKTLERCIKALSSDVDINVAINNLLSVINEYFKADRSYIFEIIEDGKIVQNTYEYVREGVSVQIDNLQDVPIEAVSEWMPYFENDEVYFMANLEQEKGRDSYEILEDQDIDNLIAVPLKKNKEIIGFLGVDNPKDHFDDPTLLSSIQYFITNSLERREKQQQLEDLIYRDMLTGLYNRNKYISLVDQYDGKLLKNIGIVYMDLNDLKETNDMYGHIAGDNLICQAAAALKAVFPERSFRVGGDEFVVADSEVEKDLFFNKVEQLQKEMDSRKVSVSMGALWEEKQNDIVDMLKQADNIMYEAKRNHHLMQEESK